MRLGGIAKLLTQNILVTNLQFFLIAQDNILLAVSLCDDILEFYLVVSTIRKICFVCV